MPLSWRWTRLRTLCWPQRASRTWRSGLARWPVSYRSVLLKHQLKTARAWNSTNTGRVRKSSCKRIKLFFFFLHNSSIWINYGHNFIVDVSRKCNLFLSVWLNNVRHLAMTLMGNFYWVHHFQEINLIPWFSASDVVINNPSVPVVWEAEHGSTACNVTQNTDRVLKIGPVKSEGMM